MSNKNKKTTVVVSNGNLPSVPDQMEMLKKELSQLKAITETQYKTTGNLESFGNIKSETSVSNLIKAFSSVRGRENAYNEAAAEMGMESYPAFEISGGNKEQWKHDIKLRIAVINHAERKAELEALIEEGKSFLTKEDQYQMYLQKVAKTVTKS